MSTTARGRFPISVRIPGRTRENDSWHRAPSVANTYSQPRELASYRLARLEAEVLAPTRGKAPTDQRLRRIISAYVTLAITDPGIVALLMDSRRSPGDEIRSPAVRDGIAHFFEVLQQDLTEIIRGQDRTPPIDPGVAVQSLLGIIHWGISSYRAEGRLSREEAAAQITFLALHGLVPRPPRRTPTQRPARRRFNAA